MLIKLTVEIFLGIVTTDFHFIFIFFIYTLET